MKKHIFFIVFSFRSYLHYPSKDLVLTQWTWILPYNDEISDTFARVSFERVYVLHHISSYIQWILTSLTVLETRVNVDINNAQGR